MAVPELAPGLRIQGFVPPLPLKDFRLIAFADSALVGIDCVDEIAEAVGCRDEAAALAEAARRSEIADRQALRRRVALLKGATVADLEAVYTQGLQFAPGAEQLVRTCKAAGLKVLLAGGFTFFTDRIRDRLDLDFTRSSVLEIRSGTNCGELTGRLMEQAWGDLCDGDTQRRMLMETCAQLGISPKQAIAVGKAATDLPMLAEAGLSVAYHAAPNVREQAMVAIDSGGLDRLLELVA